MERLLTRLCGEGDNRCRVTAAGIVIQLPADHAVFGNVDAMQKLRGQLERICQREQRELAGVEPYRQGSAFVRQTDGRTMIEIRRGAS